MTEHDRNIRTLVTCFVVAMLSLTALRFVEIGNMASNVQVLGVTDQKRGVVLPDAQLKGQILEAHYIGR